MFPLEQYATSI